jgi:hypothetical protein
MKYSYRCADATCKAQSERIQSIHDPIPDTIACPFCVGEAVLVLEAPAVLTGGMTSSKTPLDVAVGQASAARHEVLQERQAKRDKVRREAKQVGIKASSYADFQPIGKQEQKLRKAALDSVEKSGSFNPTYEGNDAKLVGK